MKAYQVFKGELSKHGHQRYDLVATYLDKQRALDHCQQIAEAEPLYGDILEEGDFYGDGKYKSWWAIGWERVTTIIGPYKFMFKSYIAQFEEIEIIE